MREQLIAELTALKAEIVDANATVFVTIQGLQSAKKALQDCEDRLIMGRVPGLAIDGKNAEIRAAQLREYTTTERQEVAFAEDSLETAKTTLRNRQYELQINLALVELVKGWRNWITYRLLLSMITRLRNSTDFSPQHLPKLAHFTRLWLISLALTLFQITVRFINKLVVMDYRSQRLHA